MLAKLALQLVVLCVGTPCTLILGFSFILWSVIGPWCIPFVVCGFVSAYVTVWLFDLIEESYDE